MRKHLKKFFVPHKHNQYNPHLFRNTSVLIIFLVCTFLLGVSYGNYIFLRKTVLGANIATNVLVDLANENRVKNNVVPLTRNHKLDQAANLKVSDMIERQYFAHFSPDGTTPWSFMLESGYDFLYAGENLAINYNDPRSVDEAWMNSPTHRENLLNQNFRDVGIATREGTYQTGNSVYVVQMFGAQDERPLPIFPKEEIKNEDIKVIQQNKNFIAVKNEKVENNKLSEEKKAEVEVEVKDVDVKEEGRVAGAETYSTWFDRFVFDSPYYIQLFFIVVIIIICFGMALRMIIEYRRQHIKHLIISGLFLAATLLLALLNLNFINIF
jgi:hypothetical protein